MFHVNVNPGLINPWAVELGGYHLSIRLWLLEEYPLINKPWFINPGLTLLQFVTCYQEVPLWPRARLEVQESLVENRLRADCPRPWKNHDSERFPCCCHSHETFHEISKHNNHNNTRQSLHPHPLTSAVRQLPSAAVSRPLRSPAWLPSPGSRFRLSIKSSRLEDASERGIAWLTESGLVCDRLRSLAITCCDQAQVYQVWCLMVFECFWSEMMWCASKSKKHLLHSCTAPVGNPDPTLSPQSLEPSVSLKRLPKGPPYLWFLGLGVAHASHGWVMQQSIAFSILHSIAFSLGKLSSPARCLQGRPGTLSTPIKHGAHCGEC